jgi:predicted nucleic acid-binding protein
MILYLDTSALVKRYFREPHSDLIVQKWQSATQIVTSSVAYAETMASIYRKKRESGLSDALIGEVVGFFHSDWQSFIRVEVSDELNKYIDPLVKKYILRGFDAIHLASAMTIYEKLADDLVFACFDRKLLYAARSEGMQTAPASEDKQ